MANRTAVDPSQRTYNKDNDPHIYAIDKLVHELGLPAEEVNRTYREVLEELKKDVKMKAFLPILASIGAKERLIQR